MSEEKPPSVYTEMVRVMGQMSKPHHRERQDWHGDSSARVSLGGGGSDVYPQNPEIDEDNPPGKFKKASPRNLIQLVK